MKGITTTLNNNAVNPPAPVDTFWGSFWEFIKPRRADPEMVSAALLNNPFSQHKNLTFDLFSSLGVNKTLIIATVLIISLVALKTAPLRIRSK